MTPCKSGDVVLLLFPFTDLTTVKQRPGVVVSADAFNARQHDVVVAAVTSQLPNSPSPEEYRLTDAEQRAAGLPKPSVVKCAKLLTIDQRLIRKPLGRLPPSAVLEVTRRLLALLGGPHVASVSTIP